METKPSNHRHGVGDGHTGSRATTFESGILYLSDRIGDANARQRAASSEGKLSYHSHRVGDLGMVTFVNELQLWNAPFRIIATESGMVTLANALDPRKTIQAHLSDGIDACQ